MLKQNFIQEYKSAVFAMLKIQFGRWKEYGQHWDPHSKAKHFLLFAWDKVQQRYLEEKSADEKNIHASYNKKSPNIRWSKQYTPRSDYTDTWVILTGLEWAETVLAADGDRETTGLMSWGKLPLATTSWTLSFAFCRMLIACWCVIVWSRACPLIARIWSASFSFPSLSHMHQQGRGVTNQPNKKNQKKVLPQQL